ncbi:MAG: hypothetical protein P4L74_02355 [Candidatus Doudnabacteria bacterium]|nr:hypothetical protein [Candidatus Doudnabacteria bacterium]
MKYKYWILGGIVIIVILLFVYFMQPKPKTTVTTPPPQTHTAPPVNLQKLPVEATSTTGEMIDK